MFDNPHNALPSGGDGFYLPRRCEPRDPNKAIKFPRRQADAHDMAAMPLPGMPPRSSPASNAERQRRFRKRHPGYFRKFDACNRARRIAVQTKVMALMRELALARSAEIEAQLAPPASPAPSLVFKTQLMLPAPVQDPAMEAIDALAASLASLASRSSREPLPIPASMVKPGQLRRAA
jgi:hypothetical protein